jgi:hypothetical protein
MALPKASIDAVATKINTPMENAERLFKNSTGRHNRRR